MKIQEYQKKVNRVRRYLRLLKLSLKLLDNTESWKPFYNDLEKHIIRNCLWA